MKYFKFSNDFENKTGVIVFSTQILKRKNDKDIITIGFSLIPPNTKLAKQAVEKAKKES